MDDETRKAFADLHAVIARMHDQQGRMVERIINLARDFENTKDFLMSDALAASRRYFDLETRITQLERGEKP